MANAPTKAKASTKAKATDKAEAKAPANPAPKGWAPTKGVQRGSFIFWQARIREASLPVTVYFADAASTPADKRTLSALRKATGESDGRYYVVAHRGTGDETTAHASWHHGAYAYARTLGGKALARTVDPAKAKAEREAKASERMAAAQAAAVEAERKAKASKPRKRAAKASPAKKAQAA